YAWYLEGGDTKILVDTGEMRPIQSADREEAIGGPIETIDQALGRFGLTPEDFDIVIHTHLHSDHCENDYRFTKARFYVHAKELERIHDPHPLDYRYLEDYIEDVEENGQIEIVENDREIVPGIRVMHTPAHTDGGMTVFVDTPAGTAAITGFCVIMENLFPPPAVTGLEMEVIPPGTSVNTYQAYDILKKVKASADILIPLHEPMFACGRPIGLAPETNTP
ncbi:MAG: N-acyl homoserine lactonase family protein, partial [Deltaproteobacteria bacterium]|nr:N-acyl homoserine lactonase family protein [Deltaproteobacteria bacterium]